MARIRETLERCFAGVAFAEADARDEALEMAGLTTAPACGAGLEDTFAAVAFAESGCHDEALEMLGCQLPVRKVLRSDFLDSVGLGGVPVWYGVAPVAN